MDRILGNADNTLNIAREAAKSLNVGADAVKGQPQDAPGSLLNDFGNILTEQIQKINTVQQGADDAVQTYAAGGQIELHQVMLAVEKADMSMQMAMQIRNKLVQAYQDLSHMQV